MDNILDGTPMDELAIRTKSYERIMSGVDGNGFVSLGGIVDPRLLKSIYQSEDWIYILIDKIASKLAQIPWQVNRITVRNGEEVSEPAYGHPVQAILTNPNPMQNEYNFKYAAITDLCVTGNALIYVSEMQKWLVQVPTELVRLNIGSDGFLGSYDIVGIDPQSFPAGSKYRLRPEQVIHVKRPNSSSVFWGLSPLIPAANATLFNKYSNEYLLNFYRKGAQPGLIFEMTEETSNQARNMLQSSLDAAYSGRSNQRKNLLLPKGAKAVNLAHTLADQQLIEYVRNNREVLINIYGVPKHELSIAESGSLGSEEYKTALRNFWQGPLMSIGTMFESAMTARLSKLLGYGYVIKLNYSNVPALQEDLKTKADTATAMLSTLTVNEVRQRIWKLPPIDGGDILNSNKPQQQFPSFPSFSNESIQSLSAQKTGDDIPDDTEEKRIKFTDALKAEKNNWFTDLQDHVDSESAKAEEKIKDLFVKTLEEQVVAAVKVANKFVKEKAYDVPDKRKLRKEIKRAMEEVEDQWRDGYMDHLEGQIDLGYDSSIAVPFNEPYKDAVEAIKIEGIKKRRALLEVRSGKAFNDLLETTVESIMKAVERGIETSASWSEVRDKIVEASGVSLGRAETIARTENLIAQSIGHAAAMKDAAEVIPDLIKVWVNMGDDRVRGNPDGLYPNSKADHWVLQGEGKKQNEPFSNGLMYPGDVARGKAADIINCRCKMLLVSKQDLGEISTDVRI